MTVTDLDTLTVRLARAFYAPRRRVFAIWTDPFADRPGFADHDGAQSIKSHHASNIPARSC